MSYFKYLLQWSNLLVLVIALAFFAGGFFVRQGEGKEVLFILGAALFLLQLGLHYEQWKKKFSKQD